MASGSAASGRNSASSPTYTNISFILSNRPRRCGRFSTGLLPSSSSSSSRCRLLSFAGVCTLTSTNRSPLPRPFSTGTPLFSNPKVCPVACLRESAASLRLPASALISAPSAACEMEIGNHAVQVFAFAFKETVLLNVQHDVQIARRPAEHAASPSFRIQNACAFLDSRRNLHRNRALPQDPSLRRGIGCTDR